MLFSPSRSSSACLRSDLRELAEVSITPEKVEGVVDQSILSTAAAQPVSEKLVRPS